MIEVKNLTRNFRDIAALKNVSFHVERGEILGLLGPNAAGKTTAMRILSCFLPATSGTVRVANFDVFADPIEVKKRIGYLPENPPLYAEMSVYSFLDFIAKIKGIDARERKSRIDAVIQKLNLDNKAKTIVKHLSKGYKQRLGIAQAIIHEPEVIILDEPTIGLDPKQIIEVRELIKSFAGKHTVVLSTHILPEVSMTCNRVVIIDKGRVVAEDTPENLMKKLKGAQQITVKVKGNERKVSEALTQLNEVASVSILSKTEDGKINYLVETSNHFDISNLIARTVINSGWELYELKKEEMSLEDVFLHLTTTEKEVRN